VSEPIRKWAIQCFKAGERAKRHIDQAKNTNPLSDIEREDLELAYAFAINHCVYIAIMTGAGFEKIDSYFNELITLQNSPRVWNHRFSDTVACYHLKKFDLIWKKLPKGPLPNEEQILNSFEQSLDAAEDKLNEAKATDFGDIHLQEHFQILRQLQNRITDRRAELAKAIQLS
jgi:hypothetical protein